MTVSNWTKVEVPSLPLDTLKTVVNTAKSAGSALETLLGAIHSVIGVLSNLESIALSPPLVLLIRTALEEIKGLLTDLTNDSVGLYYLNVPIVKTNGKPLVPFVPTSTNIINSDFQTAFLNGWSFNQVTASGGNLGFYNTVAESLKDVLDGQRPQLKGTDFVAGIVVLVGSNTLGAAINGISGVQTLFGTHALSMDRNIIPVPKDVETTIRPISKKVHITWTNTDLFKAIPYFGGNVKIKGIYVFARPKTDGLFQETIAFEAIQPYLIATLAPGNFEFITTIPDVDTTYAIAYSVAIVDDGGVEEPTDFVSLSNNVVYNTRSRPLPTASLGTPPDWIQLSSPLDLVPPLKALLQEIVAFINSVESGFGSSISGLKQIAIALETIIAQSSKVILGVITRLTRLIESLTLPPLGLYVLEFSGVGGNTFLLQTLGAALTNKSDPKRPPFDEGTELVSGIILMGGASTQNELTPLNTFFNLIAGTQNSVTKQASDAIDVISDTIKNRKTQFGADMKQISGGSNFPPPPKETIC